MTTVVGEGGPRPEHDAPLLAVTDLRVTFPGGVRAVRGTDFSVTPGEVLAIVGESGAGKTATALAIMGLLPATAEVTGSVLFRGRELRGLSDGELAAVRGNGLAMIFADSAFTPVYRIGGQIAEAVRVHNRTSRRSAAARAVELLALTGMPDAARVARAYPHQLSGGQRRRAMVAMAVAGDPAVILADEPTAALDPLARTQVLDSLQAAQSRTGAALILITHDLGVAAGRADRVIVTHDGRLVETGPVEDVFHRPRTPHTIDLLRAVPRIDRPDERPDEPLAPGGRPCSREERAVVLRVEGLVRHYPPARGTLGRRHAGAIRAVDGIGFEVRAGETLGLMGESGCGKSTALLEILRLGRPQAGRVEVFGRDTATLSAGERRRIRRDLQFILQDPLTALDPRMTIGASLAEPLHAHGRRDGTARVAESLRLVGLVPAHASRFPCELSGGQRQRAGIARALMLEPRLLIMDEPFSALDVSVQACVIGLLRDLKARLGLSYLIASHDLAALRQLADRVAVMRLGRIVEIGEADAVYDAPAHPCTRALLSAVAVPDPRRERSRRRVVLRPASSGAGPAGCPFRVQCPTFPRLTAPEGRRCAEEEPALRRIGPRQATACHFPRM